MGWLRSVLGLVLGAGLVLAACADEDPTGVGGDLLPGGVVRTYELVLDPAAFLASDTTLNGFVEPAMVGFRVLAGGRDGLAANALARFAAAPATVAYVDSAGDTQVDSLPTYSGGRVVLRVDTLRSTADGPVRLELHSLGEEWDPRSATWTLRVDSGQVRLAWSLPGGTSAALLDTATWEPGSGDSVSFAVDSQTVALWSDTTNRARGALITMTSPDARLVSPLALLRLDARPSKQPDTVVVTTVGAIGTTFVFDPAPPAGAGLRVGGVPSWRSFLQFERLDTLALPCPGEPPDEACVLRLDEVKLNYAALVLEPDATPAPLVPEDSLSVDARAVLTTPSVPLVRSPLGDRAAPSTSEPIAPVNFAPDPGAPRGSIEVPVTRFVADLAAGQGDAAQPPPSMLVLYAAPEGAAFGFGSFGAHGGASPPRLRLIVTVATEVGIR